MMFKQFYKDIDTLHALVEPFRVSVMYRRAMEGLFNAMQDFDDSVGRAIVSTNALVEVFKGFKEDSE